MELRFPQGHIFVKAHLKHPVGHAVFMFCDLALHGVSIKVEKDKAGQHGPHKKQAKGHPVPLDVAGDAKEG